MNFPRPFGVLTSFSESAPCLMTYWSPQGTEMMRMKVEGHSIPQSECSASNGYGR